MLKESDHCYYIIQEMVMVTVSFLTEVKGLL